MLHLTEHIQQTDQLWWPVAYLDRQRKEEMDRGMGVYGRLPYEAITGRLSAWAGW